MRNCLLQYFQKLLIVFSILEVPSQKLTEVYYMAEGGGERILEENHSCSFLVPFPFGGL